MIWFWLIFFLKYVHQVNHVITPAVPSRHDTSHLNMAKISGTFAEICIEFLQLYTIVLYEVIWWSVIKKKTFLQHIKQWAMYSGWSDCSGTAQRLVTTYLSSKNFDPSFTMGGGGSKILEDKKGRDEPLWVQGSRMRHFILKINLFLFTIR